MKKTEADLLNTYQQKRRQLEAQEDTIRDYQRKGQQLTEETYSEIRYLISDIAQTAEPLNEARRELSRLEHEFMETLNQEKKKYLTQQEAVEETYRKELKTLREGE